MEGTQKDLRYSKGDRVYTKDSRCSCHRQCQCWGYVFKGEHREDDDYFYIDWGNDEHEWVKGSELISAEK